MSDELSEMIAPSGPALCCESLMTTNDRLRVSATRALLYKYLLLLHRQRPEAETVHAQSFCHDMASTSCEWLSYIAGNFPHNTVVSLLAFRPIAV